MSCSVLSKVSLLILIASSSARNMNVIAALYLSSLRRTKRMYAIGMRASDDKIRMAYFAAKLSWKRGRNLSRKPGLTRLKIPAEIKSEIIKYKNNFNQFHTCCLLRLGPCNEYKCRRLLPLLKNIRIESSSLQMNRPDQVYADTDANTPLVVMYHAGSIAAYTKES
jgi:hypothetical protein